MRTPKQTLQTGTTQAVDEDTDHQTHEPLPPPLHTSLLRMRSLSEPSEVSEKISFKEFCFGSDVIWRVGSGLIWRGVCSQVEKHVFDFLQTFLFCSDASVPVWSEQVCGNLNSDTQGWYLSVLLFPSVFEGPSVSKVPLPGHPMDLLKKALLMLLLPAGLGAFCYIETVRPALVSTTDALRKMVVQQP